MPAGGIPLTDSCRLVKNQICAPLTIDVALQQTAPASDARGRHGPCLYPFAARGRRADRSRWQKVNPQTGTPLPSSQSVLAPGTGRARACGAALRSAERGGLAASAHLSYEAELVRQSKRFVADALRRIGGLAMCPCGPSCPRHRRAALPQQGAVSAVARDGDGQCPRQGFMRAAAATAPLPCGDCLRQLQSCFVSRHRRDAVRRLLDAVSGRQSMTNEAQPQGPRAPYLSAPRRAQTDSVLVCLVSQRTRPRPRRTGLSAPPWHSRAPAGRARGILNVNPARHECNHRAGSAARCTVPARTPRYACAACPCALAPLSFYQVNTLGGANRLSR